MKKSGRGSTAGVFDQTAFTAEQGKRRQQQGRPEQPGWGDRVVRETQRTEVIDDQRADQLPGDNCRKEERGPHAADQEHGC
jgi:hypothetical protein